MLVHGPHHITVNFQETAYLSIVLSLFIHESSSKQDRDEFYASHITRINSAKMSANFIEFLHSGLVFGKLFENMFY